MNLLELLCLNESIFFSRDGNRLIADENHSVPRVTFWPVEYQSDNSEEFNVFAIRHSDDSIFGGLGDFLDWL